ncbi:MAG: M56 family metallopeptidase [Verrucomicrobiota bacterium]
MTPGIGTIASAILVFAGGSFLVAAIIAALYPVTQRWILGRHPGTRAGLLLVLACAPAVVALVLLMLTLSPSLIHYLGLGSDHCQAHGHHAHFCLIHTPLLAGTSLERAILSVAGIAMLILFAAVAFRLRRVQRAVRALRAAQIAEPAHQPYSVVDSHTPFALTVGLVKRTIYLSSRLRSELSPTELMAVVAHEQAHCRRHDALRMFVADLMSWLHLPPLRRRLLADLHLASEQSCDEQAALTTGDRLGVAETILKVVRLNAATDRNSDILLPTMTGSDVHVRVDALLHPAPTGSGAPRAVALVGAGLLFAFGFTHADGLHHAVESVIHLFID